MDSSEFESIACGHNTVSRNALLRYLDDVIEFESSKILINPGISDSDFSKDIRTQIGLVRGLINFKKSIEYIENRGNNYE